MPNRRESSAVTIERPGGCVCRPLGGSRSPTHDRFLKNLEKRVDVVGARADGDECVRCSYRESDECYETNAARHR